MLNLLNGYYSECFISSIFCLEEQNEELGSRSVDLNPFIMGLLSGIVRVGVTEAAPPS